jgi:hypothetical protein
MMKRLITTLIFTLLVPPAFGMTTLSTSFVSVPSGSMTTCLFANVSSKPLIVTVTLLKFDGSVFQSLVVPAAPQQGGGLGDVPVGDNVRCVFSFSGSSKSLRASLNLTDQVTFAPQAVLPAS